MIIFGSSAAVTALSLPIWRSACRKIGLVDEPGARKQHSVAIPLAGGWAVATGLAVSVGALFLALRFGWGDPDWARSVLQTVERNPAALLALVGGALGMFLIGAWDDSKELRARPKFLAQLIVAGLVAALGPRLPWFTSSAWLHFVLTVLWILTVTNALNFSDNMNGLCAGLSLIASLWLGLIAARHQQLWLASVAFAVGGASAGFLPFNYPRARAFLGDAGSHVLGYLLAVLSLWLHRDSTVPPGPIAIFTPVLLLAVSLLDLVWVVLVRWHSGQPFYVGDTNHFSHQLVSRGLPPAVAVALLWLAAAGAGALSFYWN